MTMHCHVRIEIPEPAPAGASLLLPRPVDDGNLRFRGFSCSGLQGMRELRSTNSPQHAYLLESAGQAAPDVAYSFEPAEKPMPESLWQLGENRYSCASPDLANEAAEVTAGSATLSEAIRRLVVRAATRFGYGHAEKRFNDGEACVPAVCGTAKGSCIDINTWLLAAARSLEIRVQYMAGYWFHPERSHTHDMHCWLMFDTEEGIQYWDLAHHLKWGVAKLSPGLNPAGGRRVPMTAGRGLRFETPRGEVEISHFSEPLWVLPDGLTRKPEMTIHIDESGLSSPTLEIRHVS